MSTVLPCPFAAALMPKIWPLIFKIIQFMHLPGLDDAGIGRLSQNWHHGELAGFEVHLDPREVGNKNKFPAAN